MLMAPLPMSQSSHKIFAAAVRLLPAARSWAEINAFVSMNDLSLMQGVPRDCCSAQSEAPIDFRQRSV